MGLSADAPPPRPRADEAPEVLRQFLYYLTRDLVPVGYIEHAMARATSLAEAPNYDAYPELSAMATRWAEELSATNLR